MTETIQIKQKDQTITLEIKDGVVYFNGEKTEFARAALAVKDYWNKCQIAENKEKYPFLYGWATLETKLDSADSDGMRFEKIQIKDYLEICNIIEKQKETILDKLFNLIPENSEVFVIVRNNTFFDKITSASRLLTINGVEYENYELSQNKPNVTSIGYMGKNAHFISGLENEYSETFEDNFIITKAL